MTDLSHQLAEDRALRDAARALVSSDVALIRADMRERGIGARLADRVGDGALEVVDDAVDYAEANKGKLAAIGAAVVLWFARGPIIEAAEKLLAGEEEPEPERLADRLRALNPFRE